MSIWGWALTILTSLAIGGVLEHLWHTRIQPRIDAWVERHDPYGEPQ